MPTYKDKHGRWRYRFSIGKTRYSGSAPAGPGNREKVAAELERQHVLRVANRQWAGPMPKVSEFCTQFLEYQRARLKPLTIILQTSHLTVHVLPTLGQRKLDTISRADLDQLVTRWRGARAAPRTINVRLATVGRMLGLACEWGIIGAVPKVSAVKVPQDTPRFLSDAEARRLLEHAPPHWRSMMLIGLRTGLRVGELRGLQWGDVDLVRRAAIHVRRTDPGLAGVQANAPKGGRVRVVPLTAEALECLRGVFKHAQRKRGDGAALAPDDWVWPGADSRGIQRKRPRSESGCQAAIRVAAEEAGVSDCAWHTLRHTYASWLVARGVSLRVVQDLLGHASIRQTERYAHLAPNATHHAAVASLDFALVDEETKQLGAGAASPDDVPPHEEDE